MIGAELLICVLSVGSGGLSDLFSRGIEELIKISVTAFNGETPVPEITGDEEGEELREPLVQNDHTYTLADLPQGSMRVIGEFLQELEPAPWMDAIAPQALAAIERLSRITGIASDSRYGLRWGLQEHLWKALNLRGGLSHNQYIAVRHLARAIIIYEHYFRMVNPGVYDGPETTTAQEPRRPPLAKKLIQTLIDTLVTANFHAFQCNRANIQNNRSAEIQHHKKAQEMLLRFNAIKQAYARTSTKELQYATGPYFDHFSRVLNVIVALTPQESLIEQQVFRLRNPTLILESYRLDLITSRSNLSLLKEHYDPMIQQGHGIAQIERYLQFDIRVWRHYSSCLDYDMVHHLYQHKIANPQATTSTLLRHFDLIYQPPRHYPFSDYYMTNTALNELTALVDKTVQGVPRCPDETTWSAIIENNRTVWNYLQQLQQQRDRYVDDSEGLQEVSSNMLPLVIRVDPAVQFS